MPYFIEEFNLPSSQPKRFKVFYKEGRKKYYLSNKFLTFAIAQRQAYAVSHKEFT